MRRIAFVCVLTLVLGACGDGADRPPPRELRVAVRQVGSLDPLSLSGIDTGDARTLVQRQVLEGLTAYDPDTLRPRPAVASSWTTSPDGRTFTFLIRRGVRFHDGRPVRAEDVVSSLNRLARTACVPASSPEAGAPAFLLSAVVGYAEVAAACRVPKLQGVVAVGSSTVMISLTQPWADFPSVLANPAASVVPAEVPDREAFARRPVGTGPYRVAEPWDGAELVLRRFDGYWGDAAQVPAVRFVGYAKESLAYVDLLQQDVHYAPVPPNRAPQARRELGDDGFVRTVGLSFLGANLRSPKMQPAAFRQGLSLAVDRESLAMGVFDGTRDAAGGLASPALPGVDEGACGGWCGHDPDRGTSLVRRAYPQGAPALRLGVSEEGSNPAVAEAVAGMLREVGVRTTVVARPFAEHVRGIEAGDVDLFSFGWIPAYPALDGLLRPLFRTGSPDNYTRFSDPEVDRLLQAGRAELDEEERAAIYRRAEQRVVERLPVLPLLWYRSSIGFDPRLESRSGVMVDGLGLTAFADLSFR